MAQDLQKMTSQFRIEEKETGQTDAGRLPATDGEIERAGSPSVRASGASDDTDSSFVPTVVARGAGMGQVNARPIDKAIGAHGAWKQKLIEVTEGHHSDLKVETVRADDACEFGKWLYSLPSSARTTEAGKRVHSLHADFHKTAADVLELALAGRKEETHAALSRGSQFALLSSKLTLAMVNGKTLSRLEQGTYGAQASEDDYEQPGPRQS